MCVYVYVQRCRQTNRLVALIMVISGHGIYMRYIILYYTCTRTFCHYPNKECVYSSPN